MPGNGALAEQNRAGFLSIVPTGGKLRFTLACSDKELGRLILSRSRIHKNACHPVQW